MGQIDIGNAATEMTHVMTKGAPHPHPQPPPPAPSPKPQPVARSPNSTLTLALTLPLVLPVSLPAEPFLPLFLGVPQPRGDVMPEPTMHVDDVSPLTNPNPSPSLDRALA